MEFRVVEICPNIYHSRFGNQYELTSTMMRIQEFYESNLLEIRGKYFTLWEFMDAIAKKEGNFTYFTDWNGFNIPGSSIRKFFKKFPLDTLTPKEKILLISLLKLIADDKEFYFIATHRDKDVDHEIAHGFWGMHSEYRNHMQKLIDQYKYKKEFKKLLEEIGYGNHVIDDEVQAYFIEKNKNYMIKRIGFKKEWSIPIEFKRFFVKFFTKQKLLLAE